jgi:hypothetical protein
MAQRGTAEPDAAESDDARPSHGGISAGKGRPTPKRREAEARRRGPIAPPPRTQREAMRRSRGSKEERRAFRAERRDGILAGDDRYLLPRDRGPVRAYVRDLVDARRSLMGLFVPMVAVVLVSIVIRDPIIQYYVSLATMAVLVMIVVEGVFLGRYVTKRVRTKFPDAKASGIGLGMYAFTRATMLRRFRSPRPRVKYGEEPR